MRTIATVGSLGEPTLLCPPALVLQRAIHTEGYREAWLI
ncbi:hypothetical protein PLANPX_4597 [Lacipirellula parvula]|uniref:Uncharacterized protein n=1 Tax=Lacipirellula parvula TaxID=2650471 RepID=A0A5K7XF19_9BACT|nr:hypothetical protein PLANPX_4597 [Lacipirellula parvula]